MPASVYLLNVEKFSDSQSASVAMDNNEGDRWWQQVELQKLILASNKIKILSKDIQNLKTLITLDVTKYILN